MAEEEVQLKGVQLENGVEKTVVVPKGRTVYKQPESEANGKAVYVFPVELELDEDSFTEGEACDTTGYTEHVLRADHEVVCSCMDKCTKISGPDAAGKCRVRCCCALILPLEP